jgi:nicotinate dehydrogenase subunit A
MSQNSGNPLLELEFEVNGEPCRLDVDADRSLLDLLREELGLRGSHFGCGLGLCGACTVLVDDRAALACDTPAWSVAGKRVTTIEGAAALALARCVQQEFIRHNAAQCGYCTSGMVMACVGLLLADPLPSDARLRAALDRNLCRCGSHLRILRAVRGAAARWAEHGHE